MATNAYVLVTADPTQTQKVGERLRAIPRAVVRDVMGPYDFIVELEEDSTAELGQVVRLGIRSVPGVTSTVTCLWIQGSSEGGGGE